MPELCDSSGYLYFDTDTDTDTHQHSHQLVMYIKSYIRVASKSVISDLIISGIYQAVLYMHHCIVFILQRGKNGDRKESRKGMEERKQERKQEGIEEGRQ